MKYPDDFINKIICGDCLEVMKYIPDNSIDMVLTSPPYNVGILYDKHNDNMTFDDYFKWNASWVKECYRILKDNGRLALNVPLEVSLPKRYSPYVQFMNIFNDCGYNYRGTILWADSTRVKHTAWGSYASPSAPYLYNAYEVILLQNKGDWKKVGEKENIDIQPDDFRKWIAEASGEWKISPEHDRSHPAPFPLALPSRLIKLLTYKNDIILDPFVGSGTTVVAARNHNRRYIGIDVSSIYVDMANKKLSQEVLF